MRATLPFSLLGVWITGQFRNALSLPLSDLSQIALPIITSLYDSRRPVVLLAAAATLDRSAPLPRSHPE
jgi:hypothetical protein